MPNIGDKCVKREKYDLLKGIFDIEKENGEWLCRENRRLCYLQIESKELVGYVAGNAASFKTIDPSK